MKTRKSWYLSKAPQKKNQSWTSKEKQLILKMMQSGHYKANDIAKMYKVTKTSIYNVVRITKKTLKKDCYVCGTHLTPEELVANKGKLVKACNSCRQKLSDYKKNLRKEAEKNGLCVYCGVKVAVVGHKSCSSCMSATHRRRYAQGLCGQCGENPIGKNKISLCDPCAEEGKKRSQEYRLRVKNEA